jgi:predicted dienelactone hydrolase
LAWSLLTDGITTRAEGCCDGLAPRATSEFAEEGSYPVGVKTFTFVDTSRPTMPNGDFPGAPDRTLVTEVWYPAATAGRNATFDASGAPYPVIVHSHGFLDVRTGESYLTENLASHGYIVAAPDYPLSNGTAPGGATVDDVPNQPGDWSFVLDHVLAEFGTGADATRVGASGLSLGGLTTSLVTYHRDLRDPRIRAAVSLAGPACMFTRDFFRTTETPLLIVFGDSDQLVPFAKNGRRSFGLAGAPKILVRLREGSHTGFSGFAIFFDQSQHFDGIGCAAIASGLESSEPNTAWESFAGEDVGVRIDPRFCPLPCQKPVPNGPSMAALRHETLTKASETAFFDAYLKEDDSARCFLREDFADQNDDIKVRSRGMCNPAPELGP